MARSEFTQKTKTESLAKTARCGKCNVIFGHISNVQFDHIQPDALDGDNSVGNCMPLCTKCHDAKTNGKKHTTLGSDKHAIAKSKRIRGLTKTGFKKKIQSRSFQTNKDSEYKQTFSGTKRREPVGR